MQFVCYLKISTAIDTQQIKQKEKHSENSIKKKIKHQLVYSFVQAAGRCEYESKEKKLFVRFLG